MSRVKTQAPKGRNNPAQGSAFRDLQLRPLSSFLREPLRNGHSATASSDPNGIRTLTLTAVTVGDFSERNTKITSADAHRVKDLWLEPGDILIQRSNAPELVGTSRLYRGDRNYTIFPDLMIRVRLNDEADPRFIELVLQSEPLRQYFKGRAKGMSGSMPKIDQETISEAPIPHFHIDDQRRIVAEIEKQFTRLEAGVAALRRVQTNLKRYRAAVLKAACEGRLVPTEAELARAEDRPFESGQQLLARILTERRQNWLAQRSLGKGGQGRGKYKEAASLSASGYESDMLPEGWAWATPEQLSSSESYSLGIGPFGSNLKVSDYTIDGVPLIFVRNIRPGRFVKAKKVYVTAAKAEELKAHQTSGGDILITKMGAPPGDACLYPEDAPKAVITADCIKFRPSPLLSERRFFVHALNSEVVKPQILDITKGVAQMKVSLGRFESIAIPLPPLAEQTRIVAEVERRLSVVEELEAVITTNLQRATRLRQAVLQKAFNGGLG